MSEPVFRRLNPLTIFLELARVIGRFIYFLVFIFFVPGSGGDFVYEAIGIFVVIAAIARYLSYSYAVHDGHLIIKSGIVTRNNRTIPLSRIQNINLQRNLIHRIFGLVDLKIETAAGAQAEASLSALSNAEGEALKTELTQGVKKEVGIEETAPKAKGRTVYRISSTELFLTGATENRALAMVGAVFGGSFVFYDQLSAMVEKIIPNFGQGWVGIAVFGFVIFLVGWVLSIVSAVLTYGNFELTLEEGKLRRHYGLVNQIESVVPLPRVQVVRMSESLFQRMLHFCKLYVETAGSFEKQDMGGSSLVCPLLEMDKQADVVRTVLPGRPVDTVRWRSVSPKTANIYARRSLLVFALMIGGSSVYFGLEALWALIPAVMLSALLGWAHYRTTGYDDKPNLLATRYGVVSRRTMYVPPEKVQSVFVSQSPLQRRYEVSTVLVHTAAASGGGSASVIDLPDQTAGELAHSLHRRSADSVRLTGEVL
ncbi:MAG: PH domain-containing protein [Fimbriimonadaceae bacterium]